MADSSIIESLKVPPHSVEAEQSVLGGLLLNNRAMDDVVDRVMAEDFYRHDHRLVYTVIGDEVNIAARLEPLNKDFDSGIAVSASTRDEAEAHRPGQFALVTPQLLDILKGNW